MALSTASEASYTRPMPIRVFIVEDTKHVREMVVRMLELSEFEIVGQAATGEEALAGIAETDPDVVVVDLMMPGLDGLATAKHIRAGRPDQPIVLYTAFLDGTVEQAASEAGVALCVMKTDEPVALERAIRRLAGELF
jgi:DNA-binding NarL/FixJ family response regulator